MRRKSFLFLCLISAALSFTGCQDEDEIGLLLLPPNDNITTVFIDSTTVLTQTMLEDPLQTDELSYQLLGKINDPDFGVTTANVYAQVNLEGTPSFGTNPQADSLVLCMAYTGYYGDTTFSQTIHVYRLLDDMFIDSTYYSNKTFNVNPVELGSKSFLPAPNTNVQLIQYVNQDTDTIVLTAHIRIQLDTLLASTILSLNGGTELSSNANWLNYFKGLYLDMGSTLPGAGQGAISYFNFFKADSRMTLYFHNSGDTIPKSYDFALTGARLNQFTHDYASAQNQRLNNQLISPCDTCTVTYVQAMSGLKTKITFPFLKHFVDSGSIAINRAELTIKSEPVVVPYSLPDKMLLVTTSDAGTTIFPIDYYDLSGYYGGGLNATADGYTFNISRQIQRFLDGSVSNADFYLIVSGSGVQANRAIVKSGSNLTDRMKFSISYTKLN